MAHFRCLCLDTADPASNLATFWAAVAGGTVTPAESGGPADVYGRAETENLLVVPVPEHKTVKNRAHPDLTTTDLPAEIKRLTKLGATHQADFDEDGTKWATLTDPEGNEFDVVAG